MQGDHLAPHLAPGPQCHFAWGITLLVILRILSHLVQEKGLREMFRASHPFSLASMLIFTAWVGVAMYA